ncbi:MAG: cytochrome c family protein [Pseudomonadota bacterium]|nr:cytochrome c family protein [Pseudomonadota bacterium]
MSSFELNKIIGALLLVILVSVVIGKVANNLVSTDEEHGAGYAEKPGKEKETTIARPKAPKKKQPLQPVLELLATADAMAGKKVFAKCKACHTSGKNKKNGIGPNLWNVVNRAPGSTAGFKYSKTLKGISGKPWTYENLNAFLAKPRDYAKGTKMSFVGLKKVKDRANVIAFLRSLSDTPAPLN